MSKFRQLVEQRLEELGFQDDGFVQIECCLCHKMFDPRKEGMESKKGFWFCNKCLDKLQKKGLYSDFDFSKPEYE